MTTLQPNDEFLVNRTDTTYTQEQGTLMANLETTDYLLINREDATYKITGEDLINSVIDPLEVTVVIAPNPPLIKEDATAIPVVTGGKKPDGGYVFTYQWHYADDLLGTNQVDIPGQTASTYAVLESDIDKFIGCTCTTTDALGTTATGTGYGGPVSATEIAPIIDEVILTEVPNGSRYTDKEFPYTTVMTIDGTPDPTYALKARLSGTTFNFGVQSDTITKVEGAGENVYTTDTIANVDATTTPFDGSNTAWVLGGVETVENYPSAYGAFQGTENNYTYFYRGPSTGPNPDAEVGDFVYIDIPTIPASSNIEVAWQGAAGNYACTLLELLDRSGDAVLQTYWNNPSNSTTVANRVSVGKTTGTAVRLSMKTVATGENLNNPTNTPRFLGAFSGIWINGTKLTQGLVTSETVLTFPEGATNFDKFEASDVVQDPNVKIIDIDADATPPTITVDGGSWYGADTTGTVGGDTNLIKTVAYSTKLTVASDKDLAVITGDIYMTDGTPKQDGSGELEPASYTPVTNTIASVTENVYRVGYPQPENLGTNNSESPLIPVGQCDIGNVEFRQFHTDDLWDEGSTGNLPGWQQYLIIDQGVPRVPFIQFNQNMTGASYSIFVSDTGLANSWEFDTLMEPINIESIYATKSKRYFVIVRNTNGDAVGARNQTDIPMMSVAPIYFITPEVDATVLTFESPNPDLQYFREGDVVQMASGGTYRRYVSSVAIDINNPPPVSSLTNVGELPYNGTPPDSVDKFVVAELSSPELSFTWKYFEASGIKSNGTTYGPSYVSDDGVTWTVVDSTYTTNLGYTVSDGTAHKYFAVCSAGFSFSNNDQSWWTFGSGTNDSLAGDVKVISTDTTANTMTVDGGSWLGSGGSGNNGWNQTEDWLSKTTFTNLSTPGSTDGFALYDSVAEGDPGQTPDNYIRVTTGGVVELTHSFTNVATFEVSVSSSSASSSIQFDDGPELTFIPLANTSYPRLTVSDVPASFNKVTFRTTNTTALYLSKIWVNGLVLVDPSITGAPDVDTFVSGPTNTAEGTIASIDGTEIELSASSGRWIADNKAGTAFSFVPADPIVDIKNEAYGVLQIINDKAQVTGIQASDPGFVNVTAKDYSIKFPSVFATGNAPDTDLPVGTSISAIVKAENSSGASIKESNILLPQVPNPEGSAGAITDVEGAGENVYTTDTIASVSNGSFLHSVDDKPADGEGQWRDLKDYLAAEGVSSIKGIKLTGSGYTPNLKDVEIDGISIRIPANKGTITGESYSGDRYSWEKFFELPYPQPAAQNGEAAQGKNDYTNIFPTPLDVLNKTFVIRTGSYGDVTKNIFVIDQNNKEVQILGAGAPSNPKLIFPTNKDFDKFKVGDVVQSGVSTTLSTSDYNMIFGGNTASGSYNSQTGGFTVDFNTLEFTGNTTMFTNLSGVTGTFNVYAKDLATVLYTKSIPTFPLNQEVDLGINFEDIGRIEWAGDYSMSYFKANGVYVNPPLTDPAKITNIQADATPPTIIVDGGNWYGADTTGIVGGDTELSKIEVYDSKLTVDSPTNLDTFIANDALVMVDSTGAVASYVPVTNTIASVDPLDTGTIYTGQGSQAEGTTSAGREVQKNYLCVLGGAGYTSTAENSLSATSYIKFDTPIVLGKPSTITIEANGNAGGWVTLNPATYDNNAIPQTAGYTNFANMKGESWNTITFPEQVSVIEGFRWNGVNAGWSNQISNMLIDGAPINPERLTLTFEDTIADNPDLQYFQAGDVVQSEFDNTYDWSNHFTSPAPFVQAKERAFDGDKTTAADTTQGWTLDTSGYTFGTGTHTIEIVTGGAQTITVNSTPLTNPGGSGVVTWTDTYTGEIDVIYTGNEGASLRYIAIDGKVLADSNVNIDGVKVISTGYPNSNTMTVDGGSWAGIGGDPAGDTVVTGPAKSGTGTFVSTNDSDTVFVSDSNYEWIANDNRLGEGFYIKKLFTALNANDPAHVAMQQAVTAAFAAFPQNVSTRRTSIASSLYRLMAGETLTAEETVALTETVTTAVNATEPFAYSGYYPLYYTAAAANAASSVGDHHTHDMDGQTFYMPDGGTIYHGTYITPEETEETSGY